MTFLAFEHSTYAHVRKDKREQKSKSDKSSKRDKWKDRESNNVAEEKAFWKELESCEKKAAKHLNMHFQLSNYRGQLAAHAEEIRRNLQPRYSCKLIC